MFLRRNTIPQETGVATSKELRRSAASSMAMLCRELILRFDLQMLFLVTAFVLCSEWVHVDTIIAVGRDRHDG